MSDSLLDNLAGQNLNEKLDSIILQDDTYKQLQEVLDQQYAKMDDHGFSAKEEEIIDSVVTAYNALNAHHAKLAYIQGYKDCIALLKEIGFIEINHMESVEGKK